MAEKDPKRWDEVIIDSPFAKLTKRDVHEYYSTPKVQQAILDAVGSREAIVRQSFAPDKTVLRRKDSGGSLIRLDPGTLDQWNERRLSEVHPTFGRKTDVLLADIDPQEGVDWRRTKKITETVARTLQSHPAVRDVSVRYSGGRGFYVEGKLDSPVGIDRARNLTKQILNGLAQRHDVFFEPVGPGKIRLDTTPLKNRGSVRAPYSINADTGLVSAPVKLEELGGIQKKDFSVEKVLERMQEKRATSRWREAVRSGEISPQVGQSIMKAQGIDPMRFVRGLDEGSMNILDERGVHLNLDPSPKAVSQMVPAASPYSLFGKPEIKPERVDVGLRVYDPYNLNPSFATQSTVASTLRHEADEARYFNPERRYQPEYHTPTNKAISRHARNELRGKWSPSDPYFENLLAYAKFHEHLTPEEKELYRFKIDKNPHPIQFFSEYPPEVQKQLMEKLRSVQGTPHDPISLAQAESRPRLVGHHSNPRVILNEVRNQRLLPAPQENIFHARRELLEHNKIRHIVGEEMYLPKKQLHSIATRLQPKKFVHLEPSVMRQHLREWVRRTAKGLIPKIAADAATQLPQGPLVAKVLERMREKKAAELEKEARLSFSKLRALLHDEPALFHMVNPENAESFLRLGGGHGYREVYSPIEARLRGLISNVESGWSTGRGTVQNTTPRLPVNIGENAARMDARVFTENRMAPAIGLANLSSPGVIGRYHQLNELAQRIGEMKSGKNWSSISFSPKPNRAYGDVGLLTTPSNVRGELAGLGVEGYFGEAMTPEKVREFQAYPQWATRKGIVHHATLPRAKGLVVYDPHRVSREQARALKAQGAIALNSRADRLLRAYQKKYLKNMPASAMEDIGKGRVPDTQIPGFERLKQRAITRVPEYVSYEAIVDRELREREAEAVRAAAAPKLAPAPTVPEPASAPAVRAAAAPKLAPAPTVPEPASAPAPAPAPASAPTPSEPKPQKADGGGSIWPWAAGAGILGGGGYALYKTKSDTGHRKAASSPLPKALLDEVSKDKWATRAYGQKTLREIKEGKREVTPIQDKGKTVGFMSPSKTPLGYPSTGFVFVSPSSRGKGLAAKVLAEYAKKNPKAISFIHRDNIPSQKAHEKAGWENSGVVAKGNKKAHVWKVKKAVEKLGFDIPFKQIAMVLDDTPMYYRQYLSQQRARQQKALNAAQQQTQPQLNQFGLPAHNMFAAKMGAATEFAPGIPMNRKIHKIPTSTTPQTWTLAIQKHDADRAGTHFDLRLVPPQGGRAHSWAIPKAKLPEKGKMLLALQQPTHTANYAKNFTGAIPKGTYGSGQVDMHIKEPVKILTSGDNKVKFERDNGERYTLFRTRDKNWGITKSGSQVIDEWRKKKREEKATAFIRERMR